MWARCVCLPVIAACLLIAPAAWSEQWHDAVTFNCRDPLVIRNSGVFGGRFSASNRLGILPDARGALVPQVSPGILREYKLGDQFELSAVKLSASDAQSLRDVVLKRADNTRFLFVFGKFLPPAADFAKSIFVQKAISSYFSYLSSLASARTISLETLSEFIVAGGALENRGAIYEDAGRYILVETIEYAVSVGDELRRTLLFDCTYPIKVRIGKVSVFDGPALRFVFEERDRVTWFWKRSDGSLVTYLQLYAEDDDYLYFEKYGTCTPEFKVEGTCMVVRASKRGGEVNDKFNKDAEWSNISGTPLGTRTVTE